MLRNFAQLAEDEPQSLRSSRRNDAELCRHLLTTAQRGMQNARLRGLSELGRIQMLHQAILSAGLALAAIEGCRVQPADRHRQMVLEGACGELGLGMQEYADLDAIRRLNDLAYLGRKVDWGDIEFALQAAAKFMLAAEKYLQTRWPGVFGA
jgi:hypothetical protein